jgi:hypothetical protein
MGVSPKHNFCLVLRHNCNRPQHTAENPAMNAVKRIPINKACQSGRIENRSLPDH